MKIAVIGAGQCGLYISSLLVKQGHNVHLYEQKKQVGLPVHCTGIVTHHIKNLTPIPKEIIVNSLKYIQVNSRKESCTLALKNEDLVLDRKLYEEFLKKKAIENGAILHLNHKFIKKDKETIVIRDFRKKEDSNLKFDKVIGTDGPLSSIYNIINPKTKRKYLQGIQIRCYGTFDKKTFKVFLGSICPGFFAWVVPESEKIARIGLAANLGAKPKLAHFLKMLKVKKSNIIEYQAGLIPSHKLLKKLQKGNFFIAGDAAMHTKATTGGGIVPGLIAAKRLASAIKEDKKYNDSPSMALNLLSHHIIRKTLDRFEDNDYDRLVQLIKNKRTKNALSTIPRDQPIQLLFSLTISNPLLPFVLASVFTKRLFRRNKKL